MVEIEADSTPLAESFDLLVTRSLVTQNPRRRREANQCQQDVQTLRAQAAIPIMGRVQWAAPNSVQMFATLTPI
jgi:hypothetical protein